MQHGAQFMQWGLERCCQQPPTHAVAQGLKAADWQKLPHWFIRISYFVATPCSVHGGVEGSKLSVSELNRFADPPGPFFLYFVSFYRVGANVTMGIDRVDSSC